MTPTHKKPLVTYLRLTGPKLEYLLNFGAPLIRDRMTRIINGPLDPDSPCLGVSVREEMIGNSVAPNRRPAQQLRKSRDAPAPDSCQCALPAAVVRLLVTQRRVSSCSESFHPLHGLTYQIFRCDPIGLHREGEVPPEPCNSSLFVRSGYRSTNYDEVIVRKV